MADEPESADGGQPPQTDDGCKMHVHTPRPIGGLREFLSEISVIVVGVLIALGLEQLADQWHWSQRIHEVREQLLSETSRNAGSALGWLTISPCLDQQLTAADQQIWRARDTGVMQPAEQPFSPTLTEFTSDSWLNARSLQIADHLSPDEVKGFTQVYFYASEMTGNITTLHALAGELEPLSRPLDHVTPAEADELLAKIGRIRELQTRMELASALLIRTADRVHAPIPLAEVQAEMPGMREIYGSCVADPAKMLRLARTVSFVGSGPLKTPGTGHGPERTPAPPG